MPPTIPPLLQIALVLVALALLALARYGLPTKDDLRDLVAWCAARVRSVVAAAPQLAPRPRSLVADGPIVDGKVSHRSWNGLLNLEPDRYPHLIIVGPTGSGKTTFTRAVLAGRAGRVAVLTPKPDPNDWPGVPIVTIDDSGEFTELTAAFSTLLADMRARLVAAKRGQAAGEELTIVCDDWPVLASECGKPASSVFKMVARLGRSLRVRLIILSQSERVKSLGLEGEGDAVDNFARVDLGRDHSAVWTTDGYDLPLDTRLVPMIAAQRPSPTRYLRPEPVPVVSMGVFSADSAPIGNRFPIDADPVPAGSHALEPVPGTAEPVPDPEAAKIRDLSSQGWSRNQIASELGGRKGDALERIRRVLG